MLNNLALIYIDSDYDRTLALTQSSMEVAPGSVDIMDTYGWILVLGGASDRGVEVLPAALAPESPEIAYHLGVGLARLGVLVEAKKVLKKVADGQGQSDIKKKASALLNNI